MQIGVFDKLEGEHYANYLKVADALRSDYEFCHTTDASYIPEDGVPVKTSSVRLIKNFDDKVTVFTVSLPKFGLTKVVVTLSNLSSNFH